MVTLRTKAKFGVKLFTKPKISATAALRGLIIETAILDRWF